MQFKELRKVYQNWFFARKFVKKPFKQTFACFTYFDNFFFLEAKSSLESKILEFGFNPHTSLTLAQTFTLTLLRLISKAQMCK